MSNSARSVGRGLRRFTAASPLRSAATCRNLSSAASIPGNDVRGVSPPMTARGVPSRAPPSTLRQPRRHNLSTAQQRTAIDGRRRDILTRALKRVTNEGWTDGAVASGTLDAGLPPSYIGQASSASSTFGSSDLVAFFMDECNSELRKKLLAEERRGGGGSGGYDSLESISSRIGKAMELRLSMVLPFVESNRWHEGMAIGALPQNAYRTSQQLNEMASIVLNYALGKPDSNAAQRAAVVAAYAATELHLLSDGKGGMVSGNSISLSGKRYRATWAFLGDRSVEAARLVVDGPSLNGIPLPNSTHVMAASAVASSLAGAALSLVAPTAAAAAGYALPLAMSSMFSPMQEFVVSQMNVNKVDGTKPSDYIVATDALPPFDAAEEIFPESK